MKRKFTRVAAVLCGVSLLLSGCRIGNKNIVVSNILNDRQVFRIEGTVCSLKEARVYMTNYQNIYGTAYGVDLWKHDFGDDSLVKYIKAITMEELTQVVSMDLLAQSREVALSEDELSAISEAAAEYYASLSQEEGTYLDVTESDISEYYQHYALAQKLYNSLTNSVNEEVSDDEARVIEIMQIFVADSTKANDVAAKLERGDDFASVANNYNELSSIQTTVARDELPKEVEEVAFNLDNGQTSSKIATDKGFYFIKCLNKYNEELTEQYDRALEQYGKIISELRPSYAPYQHVQLNIQCARLLAKQGQTDKACFIYQRTSALQDSLDNLSYVRQINELRTIYQIDQLEIKNQQERNRTILWGILAVLSMLGLILLLIFLIKKGNKRLFLSKEKLEKAQQYAENSTRTKSLFLSNMSHEIRTPLNALSGFSAILTDDSIDNDTRQQCNEIIQQNSELLLKLINDVIDLSSVDVGKLTFNLKESDAVVICRNVVETVEKVKQTQAEVRFVTTLESLPLVTDDSRLQQLLINLLINATKFTTEGVITLEVEKESDTVALFSVTDTGCGIPLVKQKQIFNRFEKLNEGAQGTGLGLSICQLIIEQVGGRIWIDHEYTEGARFMFTHPIIPVVNRKENTQ